MHVDVLNEIDRSRRHSKTSFPRQTGHSVEPPRIEPVVSKAHRLQPMTTTRLMEAPDENVSEWPSEAGESCDDKPMTTTRLMETPDENAGKNRHEKRYGYCTANFSLAYSTSPKLRSNFLPSSFTSNVIAVKLDRLV